MAAVDWFAVDSVAPPIPRARPARASRRAHGRRVTGGIVWISVLGVLLAGVVAVNVAVLRVNMSVNRLDKAELRLQAENQALASQVSSAGSAQRIETAARKFHLVQAPASDTSYLDLGQK
jgi:cell division protein FtsL